jgi:hypothetical protein
MMRRFDHTVTTQQTRRAANTTGRKIGSGVPEGLRRGVRRQLRCGAVAGKSAHGPMT